MPGGRARARDLGVPLEGTPGRFNAITDVAGVEVGHVTLVSGEGRLAVGRGPIRTGATAILPRGRASLDPVFGAWHALNGNGEMTGTAWLEESGFLEGPILVTNTHSVGTVRDAVVAWLVERGRAFAWALPVVAETYDGALNDINGFHVRREHVFAALEGARSGAVPEGSVGGGTGMICHGFKGGIGSASRRLADTDGGYTLGVLAQCNHGRRSRLTVAGVPVGLEIPDLVPCFEGSAPAARPGVERYGPCSGAVPGGGDAGATGSIIVVVATDAPLLPHQLERLARRVPLGIARTGGLGENGSGDLVLAFSTATPAEAWRSEVTAVPMLANARMDPLFEATVQATEESIVNALMAAETMTGADGLRVTALPHDRLLAALRRYGRAAGVAAGG